VARQASENLKRPVIFHSGGEVPVKPMETALKPMDWALKNSLSFYGLSSFPRYLTIIK
jgi:hypothetical protein